MIRWPILITVAFVIILVIYFRPTITGRVAMINRNKTTEQAIVPNDQIKSVLPRDAIPAIIEPKFTKLSETDFSDENLVLAFSQGRDHRGYPLAILNWHEVVDDVVGGRKVAVTFCPLCGTGQAYDRIINGQELVFGVSGKLYKNNLVMYDKQTDSLWTQAGAFAITGALAGTKLTQLPVDHMTLGEFKQRYPNGLVLAKPTGFVSRNYDQDPYQDYVASDTAIGIFGQEESDKRLPAKTLVFGVEHKGQFKAYPLKELPSDGKIEDTLSGDKIIIESSVASSYQAAFLAKPDGSKGEQLVGIQSFWFSWSDFHPETDIYKK